MRFIWSTNWIVKASTMKNGSASARWTSVKLFGNRLGCSVVSTCPAARPARSNTTTIVLLITRSGPQPWIRRRADPARLLMRVSRRRARRLLGSEEAVAGVAQARHDIAVLIEGGVDGRRVDGHVGMVPVEGGQSLGTRQQADELDRPRMPVLQPVDRGH